MKQAPQSRKALLLTLPTLHRALGLDRRRPDVGLLGHAIQMCADNALHALAAPLHACLIALSISPDNFLASKLLSFYARGGRISDARRVFDDIPNKNLFSWNAMIVAYALGDCPFEALALFSSLRSSPLKPDAFSISAVLKSLSSYPNSLAPHRLASAEIHSLIIRNGIDSDIFIGNGMITVYARFDDLASARKVFEKMTYKDIITWNSMISGYSHAGYYHECLHLYEEMVQNSISPNGVTAVCALQACSHLKDLEFGMEIHRYIVENGGIEMDITLWNSIVGFYAKCGKLEYARKLFEEMLVKDGVGYSAMITGYMYYGLVDQAEKLFRQMGTQVLSVWNALIAGMAQNSRHSDVLKLFKEMLVSGFSPNPVTLSSILPSLSFYSNLMGARQIHGYGIREDCDRNIYVATALIDSYGKAGFLEGAKRVFEGISKRSVVVWTSIIAAYASHGLASAVLDLFDRMLRSNIHPDSVTITAVLSVCAHAGLVEESEKIINNMLSLYGITPTIEHYACMVGVLSRSGLLQNAVDFIKKMPIEPNAKTWGVLLSGAKVFSNVEAGKLAFDRLLAVEPENTGNYIIMANIYSKSGKWEEAMMVREMVRGAGLMKPPGCSWIEVGQGLKVFVASYASIGVSEEISEMLEKLFVIMREEGYAPEEELDEENICVEILSHAVDSNL